MKRFLGAFLLLLAPLSSYAQPQALELSRQIVRDLNEPVRTSYVLAFGARVDERPLYVESALVLFELQNGSWELLNLYRHPRDTPPGPWQVSVVFDAPVTPTQVYRSRPGLKEMRQFLQDSWWHFASDSGFQTVKGEIYAANWREGLGFAPTRLKPVLQALHSKPWVLLK